MTPVSRIGSISKKFAAKKSRENGDLVRNAKISKNSKGSKASATLTK